MFQSKLLESKKQREKLENSKREATHHTQSSVTLRSDFWSETRKARRKGGNVLAGLKEELSTKNSISNKAIFQMKEG